MIGHAGLTEQRQSWALLSGHIIGFSVVAISNRCSLRCHAFLPPSMYSGTTRCWFGRDYCLAYTGRQNKFSKTTRPHESSVISSWALLLLAVVASVFWSDRQSSTPGRVCRIPGLHYTVYEVGIRVCRQAVWMAFDTQRKSTIRCCCCCFRMMQKKCKSGWLVASLLFFAERRRRVSAVRNDDGE